MKNFILNLRKINEKSQEEFSKILGVSRPTFIAIENGERDITLGELKKISGAFDIPLEIIIDEEISAERKVKAQNFSKQALARFHNLILQCVKYGADDDGKITKTKLAKLVYLCDFASYYKFLKPISGLEYRKLPQGPVAIQFFDILDSDESLELEIKRKAQLVSLNEQPDDSVFSKEEKSLIKDICKKWKNAKTKEIVDFTHNQNPWKVSRDNEVIPYTFINTEEPENVY